MTGSTYIDFDKAINKGMKLIKTGENPNFGLLIIVGVNVGLRISDLLKLTFGDLRKDYIEMTEQKTKKKRRLTVNDHIKKALKYFEDEPDTFNCFRSQKGTVYSRVHVNRLLSQHFNGGHRYTSHSLRKGFGRRVWENDNESERALVMLSKIFNHSSIEETRKYLGIRQDEIDNIYLNL